MKRIDWIQMTLMSTGVIATILLVILSFGCGDKTTNNVYGDNSSIDTNVTDVNTGGAGSSDQSQQPDNSTDSSTNNSNNPNTTTTNATQ